jgi:hypothetical protein
LTQAGRRQEDLNDLTRELLARSRADIEAIREGLALQRQVDLGMALVPCCSNRCEGSSGVGTELQPRPC